MASYEKIIESYKRAVTTAASVAASAMLLRGVVNELVPHEVQNFIFSGIHDLRSRMSSQHTIVIEETEGYANNQIYEAAKLYLATRISSNMQRLRVSRVDETKSLLISMEEGEEMVDMFEGAEFKWQLVCRENSSATSSNGNSRQIEVRSFELSFHKKQKEEALHSYLPFILARAKEIKEKDRVTLSGLLNLVDGYVDEREERSCLHYKLQRALDPALLRPGRMDMHIHMSYCGVDAFRVLASNYHAVNDHELFPEIEGLIREVEVTPAAVAEELMRSDDTNAALQGLLDFLKAKRKGDNEDKVEKENVEDEVENRK
ncbi:hypothetical protein ACMD2_24272 [Ananas comosus]|uniref:Uncharacterized protein n=1 Tax=Ananas comosus TaxID=4615 RepID=A0A199UQ11_ANACO|nr:hypothetical protein ACMD2_24272 [Ananas comosus]